MPPNVISYEKHEVNIFQEIARDHPNGIVWMLVVALYKERAGGRRKRTSYGLLRTEPSVTEIDE